MEPEAAESSGKKNMPRQKEERKKEKKKERKKESGKKTVENKK